MKALGNHLIAEFYGCDTVLLNDEKWIEEVFIKSAQDAGATIVNWNFHKFSPHGVSGVIVISESHFTVHTWPEYGYAAIDIFTCGDLIDNEKAMKALKAGLRAKSISVSEIKRGFVHMGVEIEGAEEARLQ